MELSGRRPEFSVMVVDRNAFDAAALAESVKTMGYENTRFYPTFELALVTAQQEPPHIVVVDAGTLDPAVEKFLSDLRVLSDEILSVLIVPPSEQLRALSLVSSGLIYESVVKPWVGPLELLQAMDRAAGRLYFQFESEQLREHYTAKGVTGDSSGTLSVDTPQASSSESSIVSLHLDRLLPAVERLTRAKDAEECIRGFIESAAFVLGDVPVLYFRYVASHCSVVFSGSALLPEDKLKGIGIDLTKRKDVAVEQFFADPEKSEDLRLLVQQVFKVSAFYARAHRAESEIHGLIVILDLEKAKLHLREFNCLMDVFETAHRRELLHREKISIETLDASTGLYNRRQFSRLLDEEIARSRRLYMPVSLLLISLDGWLLIRERLGEAHSESILKPITLLMRKTSRANDLLARMGADQFAVILPHTPGLGAAVKAERFRRMMEAMKMPAFSKAGIEGLTVSVGVSEYPSFCLDADGLIGSAESALSQAINAGKNKVCLSSVTPGFAADFAPIEVQRMPRVVSGGRR